MNIFEGNLRTLLSWFHLQTETDVLVLLVSTEEAAPLQIQYLIDEVDRVDAALGTPITMMLFGSEPQHSIMMHNDGGRTTAVMGGDLVTRRHARPRSLGWEVMRAGEEGRSAAYREVVRRATFRTMRDIIEVAALRLSQLPCLVVYVRSIERPFIIDLHKADAPARLLSVLREIANLHDEVASIPKPDAIDIATLKAQVRELEESNREIDSKIEKICKALSGLQRKFGVPSDAIDGLVASYRGCRFDCDFVELLANAVGRDSPALRDQRIPRIQKMTDRLRSLQHRMSHFAHQFGRGARFSEQMVEVAARVEILQERTARKIDAPLGSSWGVEQTAANVDVWTSLAVKFVQAIELLKHLFPST